MPRATANSKLNSDKSRAGTQNSKLRKLVPLLLDWFDGHARDLPWRRTRDPYAIWVSEIMLQQTQVNTVLPYWQRWMRALPTIEALAGAHSGHIHKLWEGLGYYIRVRNLQQAAQLILQRHDGKFPDAFADVLALPGIGRYTAGAICSIAFNQPTPVLDGNVIRVLTRIFGIETNPREAKTNAWLWDIAGSLVLNSKLKTQNSKPSCSHLNQSLMELGALVCTPRQPKCTACPVQSLCVARRTNRTGELPNLGRREKPVRRQFIAFAVERRGKFLIRQRPAGVVNAHLWEFPNVELNGGSTWKSAARAALGFTPDAARPLCTIQHSITRFRITLEARRVTAPAAGPVRNRMPATGRPGRKPSLIGRWVTPVEMTGLSFPSAHRKIIAALADPG